MPRRFDRPPQAAAQKGHSISAASRLTGIPIETLRVWERRYGFPRPERRGDGQRRLFSEADIEHLRAIARALRAGFRAGDVVTKSLTELEALSAEPPANRVGAMDGAHGIDAWIDLLVSDDIGALERRLREAGTLLGSRRFVRDLAHPLLVEIGRAWARGDLTVRHEHVLSECLATQLRNMLSPLADRAGHPLVVMATLPGEPHALALYLVALYLAAQDARPRIVGPSTPVGDIVDAARAYRADVVGLTVTETSVAGAQPAISDLLSKLPSSVQLWIGGGGARALGDLGPAVRIVDDWVTLDDAIAAAQGLVP